MARSAATALQAACIIIINPHRASPTGEAESRLTFPLYSRCLHDAAEPKLQAKLAS
jgi:hypothetical protein